MSFVRFFPIFMILVVATSFSIDNDILKQKHALHAAEWTQYLTTSAQPQEIQIIANILYLLYANALIDVKIRQFIIPITRLNQAIRFNIRDYKNTAKELTTLKTLLERLSYITGARTIYNQKLKTCIEYYNAHQTPIVGQLITELQEYGQYSLNEFVESNSLELAEHLNASSEVFTQAIQPLQDIATIYTNIATGSFSEQLKNDASTNNFAALIVLDQLLKYNSAATDNIEYVLNTLDASSDVALKLMSEALDIYKYHYESLYNYIISDDFDKNYAYTLFGMNDLLPDEYKSVLPHPDNVFEHVLQTIKLYTQIELIQ